MTFDPSRRANTLTRREIEVLGLIARGLKTRDIARELYLSEYTVRAHVASIRAKLDAHSRLEAVTVGLRRDLIHLGPDPDRATG
jgi:DNA-binding NarL/FixJ family response regulator